MAMNQSPTTASHADDALMHLAQFGYTRLSEVFDSDQISEARVLIEKNSDLLRQTRPNSNSLHLAGFHRYTELEPLHSMMTQNSAVTNFLRAASGGQVRTIGLSDITVDRSQGWHKDLLRGKFQQHLASKTPCSDYNGSVYKVILYLQPSSSLKVDAGSHRVDVLLDSDEFASPIQVSNVHQVETRIGDVVIIDICASHRGADESTVMKSHTSNKKRILVSTVFGRVGAELTDQMELGNAVRLHNWDIRNPPSRS